MDILILCTITSSLAFGFYGASTFDYERWIKIKFLRPIFYIILIPITGLSILLFLIVNFLLGQIVLLLIFSPLIFLIYLVSLIS